MGFKEEHPEVQHLVRELTLIRAHNLRFKQGESQDGLMLFAEAALVLLVLERFVRAVLGADATDNDTIYNLLQKAVAKKLLKLPWEDQDEGIRRIKDVRNTLLHGNYEQAAKQAGCPTVETYFKTQFASEIEAIHRVTDLLVQQIDPATGRPRVS